MWVRFMKRCSHHQLQRLSFPCQRTRLMAKSPQGTDMHINIENTCTYYGLKIHLCIIFMLTFALSLIGNKFYYNNLACHNF